MIIEVLDDSSMYDLIYVSRSEPVECNCPLTMIEPVFTPNLGILHQICARCGNLLDDERVDEFNQYYGFSGYDEFNGNKGDCVE